MLVPRGLVGRELHVVNGEGAPLRRQRRSRRHDDRRGEPLAVLAHVLDFNRMKVGCAGVLDAINRKGKVIPWNYAYASYNRGIPTPGHVFVQADIDGAEVWIDPVLSRLNQRYPVPAYIYKKQKINPMSLYRLAGTPEESFTGRPLQQPRNIEYTPTIGEVSIKPAGIGEWVRQNPVIATGAVVAIYFLLKSKRR